MSDQSLIPPGLIPEAIDLRRAAALIKHANPDRMSLAGLEAIIAEVKGDLRITQALVAVAVISYQIPGGVKLGSPEGQSGLDALIARYSQMESSGTDIDDE
jgi:hypothetical protein